MGRVIRGSGPTSSRSDEIGKRTVRTKQKKKRQELDEIRRNALKSKRQGRQETSRHKANWKSTFSKVLANFAEKRRENDDVSGGVGDAKSKIRKSRRICERLLPEQNVGMFQNGSKGRQICKSNNLAVGADERSDARLRGNVLELLKGEETATTKLPWDKGEDAKNRRTKTRKKKRKRESNSDSSDGSSDSHEADCENVKYRHLEDEPSLLPANTKGVKRVNGEKMGTMKNKDDTKSEMKDQLTELQRQSEEDKCRRRLFEPDDGDERAENSFDIIDRAIIEDHEIRFSPRKRKCVEKSKNSVEISNNWKFGNEENDCDISSPENEPVDNFWGRSPVTAYERLCAMICIDNFENKPVIVTENSDPIVNVRKVLKGIFSENCRRSGQSSKAEGEFGAGYPLKSTITSEQEIHQECFQKPEEFSSSQSTLIGFWHPENFRKYHKDAENADEGEKSSTIDSRRTKNDKTDQSASDSIERTIKSTAKFLKELKDQNRVNMFEMEIDKAFRAGTKLGEKSDARLETPSSEAKVSDYLRCLPRRNMTKHVPTILRRSNDHAGAIAEPMNRKESPLGVFPSSYGLDKYRIPTDEISIFPFSTSSPEMEIPGSAVLTISPTSYGKSSFYHHRTPDRNLSELQQIERVNGRKLNTKLPDKYRPEVSENFTEKNNGMKNVFDMNMENFMIRAKEGIDFRAEMTRKKASETDGVSGKKMTFPNKHDAATKVPKRISILSSNCHLDNDTPSFGLSTLVNVPDSLQSFYRPNDAKSSTRKNLCAESREGFFCRVNSFDSMINDSYNKPQYFSEQEQPTAWDYGEEDLTRNRKDSRLFRPHKSFDNVPPNPKKSVVLFRPIDENRHGGCSQYFREPKNSENSVAMSMRDTVKSLRIMKVADGIGERGPQRSIPSDCKKFQQCGSPSHRQQWTENVPGRLQNYESFVQPTKFLAYGHPEGRNPQRIAIYETSDSESCGSARALVPEVVTIIDQKSEHPDTIFVRPEVPEIVQDRNRTQAINQSVRTSVITGSKNCQCGSNIFPRSTSDQCRDQQCSHRVAVMHPNPQLHPPSKIVDFNPALESTSNGITGPRLVYYVPERKSTSHLDPFSTGDSSCSQHKMKPDFDELRQFPERIQRPDERVGFFLSANSAMGNQVDTGCHCESARNEQIAYPHFHRRQNTAYNEAYHRSTRSNGVLDVFPGV